MKRIYKYEIPATEFGVIPMPQDAKILSVGPQQAGIYLWALIETENGVVERHIRIVATGQNILSLRGQFVGTVHVPGLLSTNGEYVFHIFDLGEQ